jgi:hypothetical protein
MGLVVGGMMRLTLLVVDGGRVVEVLQPLLQQIHR